MGWLRKLFGGSVTESVITGAGLGGLIGEILDNRRDRQEIVRLLQLKEARDEKAAREAKFQETLRWIDRLRKKIPKPREWWWKPPEDIADLHEAVSTRMSRDKVFAAESSELFARWRGLCRRAMAVRIMPLMVMPRTKAGDVAGPARTLRYAMDQLEADIERREAAQCGNSTEGRS